MIPLDNRYMIQNNIQRGEPCWACSLGRSILIFMALYYDLPVYKDVYRLILKIYEYTKDFPKEYKYTLGQDIYPVG